MKNTQYMIVIILTTKDNVVISVKVAYMLDLVLFLGKPLQYAKEEYKEHG